MRNCALITDNVLHAFSRFFVCVAVFHHSITCINLDFSNQANMSFIDFFIPLTFLNLSFFLSSPAFGILHLLQFGILQLLQFLYSLYLSMRCDNK